MQVKRENFFLKFQLEFFNFYVASR